jgi:hypothetical protein
MNEEIAVGTQVIIDARTKKVRASLDAPGEGTTIFAIDLIGDIWDDFSYFTEQAGRSVQADDLTKRNRYVREATAALFSHLEGVVSDVFRVLKKDSSFAAFMPKKRLLKNDVKSIHKFLSDHRGLSGAVPPLELKLLRDILNHPTATKELAEGGSTVLLDGAAAYGISIEELDIAGKEIDHWLKAVCASVPYERFLDTKRLAEAFASTSSSETPSTRRF